MTSGELVPEGMNVQPEAILRSILEYLDYGSLLRVRGVARNMNRIAWRCIQALLTSLDLRYRAQLQCEMRSFQECYEAEVPLPYHLKAYREQPSTFPVHLDTNLDLALAQGELEAAKFLLRIGARVSNFSLWLQRLQTGESFDVELQLLLLHTHIDEVEPIVITWHCCQVQYNRGMIINNASCLALYISYHFPERLNEVILQRFLDEVTVEVVSMDQLSTLVAYDAHLAPFILAVYNRRTDLIPVLLEYLTRQDARLGAEEREFIRELLYSIEP